MELDSIIARIDSLRFLISDLRHSTGGLLRLVSQLRLDWGYEPEENSSDDFTAGDTKPLLIRELAHESHPLSKHSFHIDNEKAISKLVAILNRDSILTKNDVIELHKIIAGHGGKLRSGNVTVHADHADTARFSDFKNIEAELDSLIGWYNSKKQDDSLHPLFLAGTFHHRLVLIHPFEDGNGRLARILTSLILLNYRIPPPFLNSRNREFYLETLNQADNGNIEPWFVYLGSLVISSMENMISQNSIR